MSRKLQLPWLEANFYAKKTTHAAKHGQLQAFVLYKDYIKFHSAIKGCFNKSGGFACMLRGFDMMEFQDAIKANGLVPPDNIPTGKIIAFAGLDKPKTNKAARCLLFPDRRGGWFMDYSTGLFEVWQAKRESPYTEAERAAFREQCKRDRLAREKALIQTQQQTATKARKIEKRAVFADDGNGYLQRKQVQPHGTKTGDSGGLKGVLIVPLYDENLKLVNLQFIQPDGTKRFLSSGKKSSCFWWLGKKSDTVLVAEGFSTAASLHEATGNQVFIAFDAGNLANVAKIVRAKNPDAEIIIMGDNDENRTGQKAAHFAALACRGRYLIPDIVGYDWNDAINAGVKL